MTIANDDQEPARPEGWGKRGPLPKQLTEGTILGLPVGRERTVVPPDQVQELAALGCHNREIANFFGVKEDTVARNFARELTKGREELKITLRRAMLNNACRNMSAAVQIFLAKNILGMSDIPMNSEAHAPLPWTEADVPEEEQIEMGVETDEEN
jgi:hypothetical protein